VISTEPSDTIQMRGWQVVLEGCYQLFVNSTLSSSCGQLIEKQLYIKMYHFLGNISYLNLDAD
jgi:hypothetical protein